MAAAINDAENRIVGMMVGSAVADAIGIYTDQLTKQNATDAYGRRVRIVASYKANELTIHYPDQHRAQYGVSCSAHNDRSCANVLSILRVFHS